MKRINPIDVSVEVINDCNLRCKYCYAMTKQPDEDYGFNQTRLSRQGLESILNTIVTKIKPFVITLEGGEPFMHPEFLDYVEICAKTGIETDIVTNGTFITEEKAKVLKQLQRDYGIGLQISLDSYKEAINNKIRGGYKQAVQGMQHLKNNEIIFTIGIVLHKQNASTIIETMDWLIDRGYNRIHIMNIMPTLPFYRNRDELQLPPQVIDETWKKIMQHYEQRQQDYELGHPYKKAPEPPALELGNRCTAAITRVTILANGNVLGCDMARGFTLGNIFTQDWDDIWHSDGAKTIYTMNTHPCIASLQKLGCL